LFGDRSREPTCTDPPQVTATYKLIDIDIDSGTFSMPIARNYVRLRRNLRGDSRRAPPRRTN